MAVVVVVMVVVVVIGRDMALRCRAHGHRNCAARASQLAFTALKFFRILAFKYQELRARRKMPKHDHLEALGGMNIMFNKTARAAVSEEYHQAFFDPFYPVIGAVSALLPTIARVLRRRRR